MGKLKLVSFLYLIFSLLSCKENSFIVIKNKGELSQNIYRNKNYNICNTSTFIYKSDIDTIRLGSSNIPKQLKKHFLFVSKQSSDIVFRGIFKTSSVGDFFLIHNTFESSLNKFTDKTLKELNKIPITNYTIEEKINLAQEAKTKSLLFVEPSNFIKNTQINILSYDIYNKVDSFAIIECHLPIENKHSVFRAIYCIDIKKTKKNLDMPDMYRKDFRRHILNWVASFDTVLNRIEPKTVNNLFNYGDSILSIYGYKAALDSLISLEKFYTQKNDFQSKSLYYQVLMTFSSFIGDNLSSLKYEARTRNLNNNKVGNFPEHTQRIDAIDFILKKYSKESIIMLNEAHNRGQTRDFTKRLLAKLYEKGFRFLAVEALDYKDSLMNKRKFPVTESGYYIKEPAFGQFIREALHLGFNLISYEDTSAYNPNIPFKEGLNIREKGQTQNILSVLKQYPNAKILIYAGHDHIHKKANDTWIKMGERLCSSLNQNIPSIDCTLMKEGFERTDENSMYKAAIDSFSNVQPFVLIQNDTPYVHPSLLGKVDVNVFFPRTNYDLGYPNWLKETDDNYFTLKLSTNLQGELLQVYKAEEWLKVEKKAIPIIQLTVLENKSEYKLYLKKGDYKAFILNGNKKLFEKSISVK